MNQEGIKELLLSKGIKPSFHRLRILQYLLSNKNHPTADMIYREISADIPTLSKTTIYNTLKTFLEHGVIQAITIEDNEVRFDGDTMLHGHFKCLQCSTIYDLPLEKDLLLQGIIDGHRVTESHIYLKGICRTCLAK